MKKIAISIGDINGVGLEIALKSHKTISQLCEPLYIVDEYLVDEACKLLKFEKPNNFTTLNLNIHIKIEK